jgi:phosphatidylserine decarboxylase
MSAFSYAAAQVLKVIPRARVGQWVGRLADYAWSPPLERAVIGAYSRLYDVRLDECVQQSGWESFDAFFTRRLRDGVRPIDHDPRVLVSPADGRVESLGRIDDGCTFLVKGRPYQVEELVGDAREAARFRGGAGCVIYLSPRDYHRVHSPIEGEIRLVRSMPGDYYPVNAIGMRHVANLFARNRRVAISIDNPTLGRVTVVMVVAMIVGRITVSGIEAYDVPLGDHHFSPPRDIRRGDELGAFHLGSTAVVLTEKRAAGEWLVEPGPIRFGQALLSAGIDAQPHSTNGKTNGDGGQTGGGSSPAGEGSLNVTRGRNG